jgi:hypothetical protein
VQRRALSIFAACAVAAATGVGVGPTALPAQASTGEVMVAGANLGGGLYYEWQTDGTSTWHKETVSTASGWDSPSMAVASDGNVVIAAVDAFTGTLYYWWQAYGSTNWNQQQVSATGAVAEGSVSIAVQQENPGEPGDVVIVAQDDTPEGTGQNPSFTYYSQAFGTTPWNTQTLPGGYDGQTDPYVTVAPNDSVVVVFSPGVIDTDEVSGFWLDQLPYLSSSWSSLHVSTGNSVEDPEIVEQPGGGFNETDVNDDGGVDYYWSPADDIYDWYGQTVSTQAGSITEQGVSIANDTASGEIAIAAIQGTCEKVFLQPYGTTPWNAASMGCPGSYPGNPEIAAESTGGLVATGSAESGQAYFYWQDSGGAWHTESLPGLTQVDSTQVAIGSYNP